jgi:hypothetical protein
LAICDGKCKELGEMECQDLTMVVVETDPLPYMLVTTIVCDILVLFILVRAMLDI